MKQSERRDRTRGAILAAAEQLFREQGVEATKIDDIAAAAAVARGSVYNAFASKEEIVLAIGRRDFSKLAEAIRARLPSESPIELVSYLMVEACRWHRKNRHLSQTLLLAPFRLPPDAALKATDSRVSFRKLAEEILRRGQQVGEIRRDLDASILAQVLAGIFVQAVAYWLRVPKAGSLEHWTRQLLEIFFEGARRREEQS